MKSIVLVNLFLLNCGVMAKPLPPNIVLLHTDDQSWAGTAVCMDRHLPDSRGEGYITPAAERLDGWKLVHAWKGDRFHLYHVSTDHSERNDLMASEPERAEALKKERLAYLREVGQDVQPQPKDK